MAMSVLAVNTVKVTSSDISSLDLAGGIICDAVMEAVVGLFSVLAHDANNTVNNFVIQVEFDKLLDPWELIVGASVLDKRNEP